MRWLSLVFVILLGIAAGSWFSHWLALTYL